MLCMVASLYICLCRFCSVNPSAADGLINGGEQESINILNGLDWGGDAQLARSLQDSVLESSSLGLCRRENVRTKRVDNAARWIQTAPDGSAGRI
jgi:hypothetical protein